MMSWAFTYPKMSDRRIGLEEKELAGACTWFLRQLAQSPDRPVLQFLITKISR